MKPITILLIPAALLLTNCLAWPEPGSLIPTLTALASSPTPASQDVPGTPEIPSQVIYPTHTPEFCVVTADEALNLRAGPGVEYQIIYWLEAGETLRIAKKSDGWIYVTTQDNRAGWVNSFYCE